LPFDPIRLYGRNFREGEFSFFTSHSGGLQQITIGDDNFYTEVNVSKVDTTYNTGVETGSYQLMAPKQDIIITCNGYLAFTPDSYFLPKRCEVINLEYDFPWALENTDYIVMDYGDYVPPIEDDGWLVAGAKWKREDLFISDDRLSFCFSAPHLDKDLNKSVPVDWIEINIKVLPLNRRPWLEQLPYRVSSMFERLITEVRARWLD
jgi:hypothetical protein